MVLKYATVGWDFILWWIASDVPKIMDLLRISKKQTYSQCENSQVSMEFRRVSSK